MKDNWQGRVYHSYKGMKREDQDRWRKLRRSVLERDHHTCYRCEKVSKNGKGLGVHHIIPRDDEGSDDMDNLITLCHPCHDYVEINELRSLGEIAASSPVPVPVVKEEVIDETDWHVWVYGGGRNPQV